MEECWAWSLRLLARQRDITDEMRPDDEQRSRLLWLRSIDAEFAHTVVESGAVEARRAAAPAGPPGYAFQPIKRTVGHLPYSKVA
jgi:hypothetical protein